MSQAPAGLPGSSVAAAISNAAVKPAERVHRQRPDEGQDDDPSGDLVVILLADTMTKAEKDAPR